MGIFGNTAASLHVSVGALFLVLLFEDRLEHGFLHLGFRQAPFRIDKGIRTAAPVSSRISLACCIRPGGLPAARRKARSARLGTNE